MCHRRVEGRHVTPDGLVVLLQGNGVELLLALGRRLHRGKNRNAILGVELLDQLPAVPLFVRDQKEVPSEDGACQMGQPVSRLRDRRVGVGGQGDERFFRRLVLGIEGADGFTVVVFLGYEGVLHGLAGVRFEVLAFSCKKRGFCPSCAGRRMAQMAAHLVEPVIP